MKGKMFTKVEYKRFLDEREAAEYSGMKLAEFRRFVDDEGINQIPRANGRFVFDVVQLDNHFDGNFNYSEHNSLERDIATLQ
ncbi:MAG: hypothetical protein CMM93_00935 [Rickettsiales bacterium]|nr:hypothetical protein [Rickettsiales bacterium]